MRPLFSSLFTAISCVAGCAEVDSFSQLESEILVPSCGFPRAMGRMQAGYESQAMKVTPPWSEYPATLTLTRS
jgi:hypothetical protein